MATAAPADSQTPTAAPAAPSSAPSALDAAMAAALQTETARAQAIAETGEDPATQDAAEPAPAPATAAPAERPAEGEQPDAQEEAGSSPTDAQPKPSRREAARLAEQLTQAEQRTRDLQAKLAEREAADRVVVEKWGGKLGTPEERATLTRKIADSNTPWQDLEQARVRLREMDTAQQELAPLYQAIEQQVFSAFVAGLDGLRTLDGMDADAHQAIFKAKSGAEALKLMHTIGAKAAKAEADETIAALEAKVSELQTKLAASTSQPAAGQGTTPGATGLGGLMRNGVPTDEAEKLALSGRLLGASLSS